MKKLILLLLFPLLLLCGCSEDEVKEGGTAFWYLRNNYQYGTQASMFDAAHVNTDGLNIPDTLALYLKGSSDQDLKSPFPDGTTLVAYKEDNDTVTVTLNMAFADGSPAQVSCSAICLIKTLSGITDCSTLLICLENAPDSVYLQLTADDYALFDDVITDVVTSPDSEVIS